MENLCYDNFSETVINHQEETMIINEIDENNSKNNRTIDTENGIYLKAAGANLREHNYFFVIVDGETIINIATERDNKVNKGEKINSVSYKVISVDLLGQPRRKDYRTVIKEVLNEHGDRFRYSEKRFGYMENVDVTINPIIIKKLRAWEDGNV